MIKEENTPAVYTERLILRKFEVTDDEALFAILSDKDVNTFLPWFPLKTLMEAQAFLQHDFLCFYKKPSAYRYAICLKDYNIPIGYVCLSDDDSHDLGYGLKKGYWHRGIVTEAAKAVVKQISKAGYTFITATHDINNPHSGGVMRNLGMTYKYSYVEQWQPKDFPVTFRMYQLNLDGRDRTYMKYWDMSEKHFLENPICQ
jgi:ribosomal-protein-alanine N-acetyltransferase